MGLKTRTAVKKKKLNSQFRASPSLSLSPCIAPQRSEAAHFILLSVAACDLLYIRSCKEVPMLTEGQEGLRKSCLTPNCARAGSSTVGTWQRRCHCPLDLPCSVLCHSLGQCSTSKDAWENSSSRSPWNSETALKSSCLHSVFPDWKMGKKLRLREHNMSPNYTNVGETGKSHTVGKIWVWLYPSAARLISAGLNFLRFEIYAYILDFYMKPGC